MFFSSVSPPGTASNLGQTTHSEKEKSIKKKFFWNVIPYLPLYPQGGAPSHIILSFLLHRLIKNGDAGRILITNKQTPPPQICLKTKPLAFATASALYPGPRMGLILRTIQLNGQDHWVWSQPASVLALILPSFVPSKPQLFHQKSGIPLATISGRFWGANGQYL